MNHTQSLTLRALGAMAIGCLLVAFPDESTKVLVAIIGLLFLIPGLVSTFSWRKESGNPLPLLVGVGSMMAGLVLVLFSASFIVYLKYVLGAFLTLTGALDVAETLRFRRETKIGGFFFVMPLLFIVIGLVAMLITFSDQNIVHLVLGYTLVIYGVVTIARAIRFRKLYRKPAPEATPSPTTQAPAEPTVAPTEADQAETPSPETPSDHSAYLPHPQE